MSHFEKRPKHCNNLLSATKSTNDIAYTTCIFDMAAPLLNAASAFDEFGVSDVRSKKFGLKGEISSKISSPLEAFCDLTKENVRNVWVEENVNRYVSQIRE